MSTATNPKGTKYMRIREIQDEILRLKKEKDFCKAIIYYISGMTDNYAIEIYNKIIRF